MHCSNQSQGDGRFRDNAPATRPRQKRAVSVSCLIRPGVTPWRRSVQPRRHLCPGTHITTLGADESGKCEIAADALKSAVVVVDDRRLAVEMGAVGGAGLGPEVIHAELGEVLAGKRSGRTDAAQITVFASVGLAFQDLAAGWLAYTLARQHGIGRSIDLLG
jgi:ornithine cyclodeaminase/alanine dehydrogenase-like protein (mu-crystallin family)